MPIEIRAISYEGQSVDVTVTPPNECPICHIKIDPRLLHGTLVLPETVEVVFQCTNGKCRHVFVSRYQRSRIPGVGQSDPRFLEFAGSVPIVPIPRVFDSTINSVSPSFVQIHNQAGAAENHGLDQLVGPGYRKALEFLIKDYLKTIPENTERHEAIEKTQLGGCIANLVSDPKLKLTASRATWLGNDETHYMRKWVGKDITDLKMLIDLTLHWISSEVLTRELEASMPDPKKTAKED